MTKFSKIQTMKKARYLANMEIKRRKFEQAQAIILTDRVLNFSLSPYIS